MGPRALVLLPVLALLATACAHSPMPASATAPRPSVEPPLAPPRAVGARSASQVIHGAYAARAVTLRTAIVVNDAGLEVIGVTATGQRIFTARYDGTKISADRGPFVPEGVDPVRVLADMQLALWPLDAVRPVFREQGLLVSEPFVGVRRLMRDQRLLAEVHYASADPWNGRLWFVNFEFDYSLTIDTTSLTN